MLLVASETGHVYTFATRKLQPMITSEAGKALIQTCLNSPDPPVSAIPNPDQRMSATGYEETDLSYSVNENEEKVMKENILIFVLLLFRDLLETSSCLASRVGFLFSEREHGLSLLHSMCSFTDLLILGLKFEMKKNIADFE